MNYCCFFGHGDFLENTENEKSIKKEISMCVENRHIYNFYIGGYGGFDSCCARYVKELKKVYPQIKSYLVLAYLNNKLHEYDKKHIAEMYDETIYPPIEHVPLKYAILKRNEWMVNNSNYIVFFVNRSWGGASKMLDYAIKKKKDYINIASKKA